MNLTFKNIYLCTYTQFKGKHQEVKGALPKKAMFKIF